MKLFNETPDVPQREFYGQGKFPQPYILASGYVTSAGATGVFIIPDTLVVAKTATGIYKITHKIGFANRYIVIPTPIITTDATATVANVLADTVEVRTFNTAGAATDTAFSFVIYSF